MLLSAKSDLSKDEIRSTGARIQESLMHRGPDDSGLHISTDERCVLISRRLAIQDLSLDGHMPISNEDGNVWTAFNGEIYNFRELREELRAMGHRFKSGSDSEIIVHAYESWGPAFLRRLDGMFAIALYDERNGRLLLARDRCGEKPLYFGRLDDGSLVFASEIKALLEFPSLRRRVDPEALWQYLTYGYVMPPRTLFACITKIAPGEVVVAGRNQLLTKETFWTPLADAESVAAVRSRSEADHVNNIRALLEASVRSRMIADVPVGAFLSGGVDSSTVVALMARLAGRPIETVTIVNPTHPDLDEWAYAERVARAVGARTHRVELDEQSVIDALPDIVWHLDEPIADPAALNTFFASKALRSDGVIVSLVGEGADELFLGYENYLKYGRAAQLARLCNLVPGMALRVGETIGRISMNAMGADGHAELWTRALRGEPLFLGTEVFFRDQEKLSLAGSALPIGRTASEVTRRVHREAPVCLRDDPLALFSYSEVRMRMAEKLLMRVDKMASAHSLEIRSPFLDHRLVDYVLSIPSALRTTGGTTKSLLKQAVEPLIPPEVIHRRKQGFATPMAAWLKNDLGAHFEARLGRSNIVSDGILDANGIRALIQDYRAGTSPRRSLHTRLWNLLILVEWYDRFAIEGVETNIEAMAA